MEWLKKILETVEGADALYDDITKGVGKSFVAKADFNAKNTELKEAKRELEDLQGQVDGGDDWKKKHDALKTQYDTDTEKLRNDLVKSKQDFLLDVAIRDSGVRTDGKVIKAFKALLDMEKIKVTDDGKLEGFEEQVTELKKSDLNLFATQKQKVGDPPTPGAGDPPPESYGTRIARGVKDQQKIYDTAFRKTVGLDR